MSNKTGTQSWEDLLNAKKEKEERGKNRKDFKENLHVVAEGRNRYRFLGNIYQYFEYWIGEEGEAKLHAIVDDPNGNVLNREGYRCSKRYAINAMNRETGELKVLKFGKKIYEGIELYMEDKVDEGESPDPSGENAPDFIIRRDGTGRNTAYRISYSKRISPWTKEEKATIKEQGLQDLESLFPSKTNEQVEELYKKWLLESNGASAPVNEAEVDADDDEDGDDVPF